MAHSLIDCRAKRAMEIDRLTVPTDRMDFHVVVKILLGLLLILLAKTDGGKSFIPVQEQACEKVLGNSSYYTTSKTGTYWQEQLLSLKLYFIGSVLCFNVFSLAPLTFLCANRVHQIITTNHSLQISFILNVFTSFKLTWPENCTAGSSRPPIPAFLCVNSY